MFKEKWYFSTWFIALLFAFWFLIIPLIAGVALLWGQYDVRKKQRKEWEKSGFGDLAKIKEEKRLVEIDIELAKKRADKELKKLNDSKDAIQHRKEQLEKEYEAKKKQLVILDEELLLQSYGFYDPKFDLESSAQYKLKLDEIREQQKALVKEKRATDHFDGWVLEGSRQQGRVWNNQNIKMAVRSFNNECDVAISKVKFNNIDVMERRIENSYRQINKMNEKNKITITNEYKNLKLQELYLAYEYEQKKKEEKEEQQRIKEQMREEAKIQKEIEEQKKKIEKEETHFKKALNEMIKRHQSASDKEKELLEQKIKELEAKLEQTKKNKEDVLWREQNTRAGYVYIISNIGSFGEDCYKIGMTRRLEPMDRVRELGDASVPFTFDVHAMIFSEDAPKLERALHQAFDHKRVNLVNSRKEFFYVTLSEIEEVVRREHNKVVEFTKLAEAEQYRQSQKIREQQQIQEQLQEQQQQQTVEEREPVLV